MELDEAVVVGDDVYLDFNDGGLRIGPDDGGVVVVLTAAQVVLRFADLITAHAGSPPEGGICRGERGPASGPCLDHLGGDGGAGDDRLVA